MEESYYTVTKLGTEVKVPSWPLALVLEEGLKGLGLNFRGSIVDKARQAREYRADWFYVLNPMLLIRLDGWLKVFDAAWLDMKSQQSSRLTTSFRRSF